MGVCSFDHKGMHDLEPLCYNAFSKLMATAVKDDGLYDS